MQCFSDFMQDIGIFSLVLCIMFKKVVDFYPPPLYNLSKAKLYQLATKEKEIFIMRITIDTDNKVIICPKTFWEDMRKTNEILRSVGQPELSHKAEVKKYFEEAIANDLVRANDVKKRSTSHAKK